MSLTGFQRKGRCESKRKQCVQISLGPVVALAVPGTL